MTPDEEQKIAQAYDAGVVVRKLGVTNRQAREIAARHGVPLRRRGNRVLAVVADAIRSGIHRGEPDRQIAAALGVSVRSVQRARRAGGILTTKAMPVREPRFDARCLMLAAAGWMPTQIARKLGASIATVSRALRGEVRR